MNFSGTMKCEFDLTINRLQLNFVSILHKSSLFSVTKLNAYKIVKHDISATIFSQSIFSLTNIARACKICIKTSYSIAIQISREFGV